MFREALDLQEPFTTKPLDYIQEDPIIREIHEDKHDKRAADADLAESGTAAQMESGPRMKRQRDLLDTETHAERHTKLPLLPEGPREKCHRLC